MKFLMKSIRHTSSSTYTLYENDSVTKICTFSTVVFNTIKLTPPSYLLKFRCFNLTAQYLQILHRLVLIDSPYWQILEKNRPFFKCRRFVGIFEN